MRAVDLRIATIHHDSIFVRAVNVSRAQDGLPAGRHTAGRREDVVVTVPLVELRTFNRRMRDTTVEDHSSIVKQFRTVLAHAIDRENALDTGSAVGPRMDEVRVSIVVPERARIDPTFRGPDQ